MLETQNIKPYIGSIVHVDAETLCGSDSIVQQCLALLDERGVLVFPQIRLTDAQQLALTDRMGARINYTRQAPGANADEDDVYTITLDPKLNKSPEYVLGTFF